MVDATSILDPHKPPRVTLSQEELDEAEAQIAEGLLPPDWFARYYEEQAKNVFGDDHKKDKHGEPIEQGIGSVGNMSLNAVNAYIKEQQRREGGPEPHFEEHLARMRRQLAECEARRAAERKANPNKWGRR
jgi:hypothetical protein